MNELHYNLNKSEAKQQEPTPELNAINAGSKKFVLIPQDHILGENGSSDEYGWHALQPEESLYRSELTTAHTNWLTLRLPGIQEHIDLESIHGSYYVLHSRKANSPLRHLDGHIDKAFAQLPTIEPGGDIPANQIEHTEEQKQEMKAEALSLIMEQEEEFPVLDRLMAEDGKQTTVKLVTGNIMSVLHQISRPSLLNQNEQVSPITRDAVAVAFGPEGAEFIGYKYGKISEVVPTPTAEGESRSKLESLVKAISQTVGYDEVAYKNISKEIATLVKESKKPGFSKDAELDALRNQQYKMNFNKDEFTSVTQYLHNQLLSAGKVVSRFEQSKQQIEESVTAPLNQPMNEQEARRLFAETQLGPIIDSEWRQTAIQSKYDSYTAPFKQLEDEQFVSIYEINDLLNINIPEEVIQSRFNIDQRQYKMLQSQVQSGSSSETVPSLTVAEWRAVLQDMGAAIHAETFGRLGDSAQITAVEFKQLTKVPVNELLIASVLEKDGTERPTVSLWKEALWEETKTEVDQELTSKVKDFLSVIGQGQISQEIATDPQQSDTANFAIFTLSQRQPEKVKQPEAQNAAIHLAQTTEQIWEVMQSATDITSYEELILQEESKRVAQNKPVDISFADLPESLKRLSYFLETQSQEMGLPGVLTHKIVLDEYRDRIRDSKQIENEDHITRLVSHTAITEFMHWQHIATGMARLQSADLSVEDFINLRESHDNSILDFNSGLIESVLDFKEVQKDWSNLHVSTRDLFIRLESLGLSGSEVTSVVDSISENEKITHQEAEWLKQYTRVILPAGHRGNYTSTAELLANGLKELRSGKQEINVVMQMAAGGHPTPSMLFPAYSSTMLNGIREISALNEFAQTAELPTVKPDVVVLNAFRAAQTANHSKSPELWQAAEDTRQINEQIMNTYLKLDFVSEGKEIDYRFIEDLPWGEGSQAKEFQDAALPYADRIFNLDVTLALNENQQKQLVDVFGQQVLSEIQTELKTALINNKSQKSFKQTIMQLSLAKREKQKKVIIPEDFWQQNSDMYAELEQMYTAAEGLYAVARMGLARRNPETKEEEHASIQDSKRYAIMHLLYFADIKRKDQQDVPTQINYISEDEQHFRKVRKYLARVMDQSEQFEVRTNTFDTGVSETAERKSYYPDPALPLFSEWNKPESQQVLIDYLCAGPEQLYSETEKQTQARFRDTNALLRMPEISASNDSGWYEEKYRRATQYVQMLLQIQAQNVEVLERMNASKDVIEQYQSSI